MRDHDRRNPRAQRLDRILPVLVDIDNQVRRTGRQERIHIDILRSANFRHAPNLLSGMYAKASAGHKIVPQVEREQQFGQAGYKRSDA